MPNAVRNRCRITVRRLGKHDWLDTSSNLPVTTQTGGEGSAYSYILAPAALAVGDAVRSGPAAAIRPGNALPLINIPVGQAIHNIELKPGAGGQLVRAAGTSAVLVSKSAPLLK